MAKIKKTNIYQLKTPVKTNDYWIGTNGDTEATVNFSAGDVAGFVVGYAGIDNSVTGLVSVGSAVLEDGVLTLTDVNWRINSVDFNVEVEAFAITPAPEGFYRTDIVQGNEQGILTLKEGAESESNPVQPVRDSGNVLITVVNIFGEIIIPDIPATNDFKRKSEEAQFLFINGGEVDEAEWNSKNAYRYIPKAIGDNLTLGGLNATSNIQYLYDGRAFRIINSAQNNEKVTLKHLDGTAIPFFFPKGQDLVIKQGQIATFLYSSVAQRLEFVSISNDNVSAADIYYAGSGFDTVQEALDSILSVDDTPDATSTIKGKIRLAGDLSGTADNPTVPGVGTALSAAAAAQSAANTAQTTANSALTAANNAQSAATAAATAASTAQSTANSAATAASNAQSTANSAATAAAAANDNANTRLPIATPVVATTTITFDTDRHYGSTASPLTDAFSVNYTDAKVGVTIRILHQAASAPTFPGTWRQVQGTPPYVPSTLNVIEATFFSGTIVHYSIYQVL